ncbi:GatB/YqeY domain-containing protein [Tuanshanicoccus lijuaniae]|uniref:GatB/YqeY domain-containing protein n=1 Tax=Aerococcaceae bacterium zg-1292 TaxID=2774330 RepID=UPI001BD840E7|nr:GatB/YqeY domain-containing protein [Aerococcaceae bacterium zg-BR22]MBS4455900.1 GatB/YqeY domain-containing protein [Aerococcaceae bacterium zg-A91]MBS4457562.1 GatB/YqeY domain-containing protein [Aerococcaceae bacterium zg-BR33]
MTLTEQITQDLKTAMKAQDKETLKVVRMLKAALQKEQLEHSEPLTPEQELMIIAREMKQRKDSLVEFEKAERMDLVEPLLQEIKIVERYLPAQLSKAEVAEKVQAIIASFDDSAAVNFGAVMGKAMGQLKGQADGQVVNQVVKELLSK